MKKLLTLCAVVATAFFGKAQVALDATGGTLTGNYTSINAAFAAINAGTHTGVITMSVTASLTEPSTPTALIASGQGAASYTSIYIMPTVAATITGAPGTARGVLELDGADNVVIDGDISGGSVTKDLTIINNSANTIANTAVIRFIGRTTGGLGSTGNTIKNCIFYGSTQGNDGSSGSTVTSSYGIYFGGATLSTTGTGDNNDNNIVQNNEIRRAYIGFYNFATTANPSNDCLVTGNIIGSNIVGETVTFGGINLSAVVTNTIQNNQISNLKLTTSVNPYGIQVASATSNSVLIQRNNITGIWSTSTGGWGAYGINLTSGTNYTVMNNTISDIQTTNYSNSTTTWNAFGIRVAGTTGTKIFYNSVNIIGSYTNTTNNVSASAGLVITSTAFTGEIRNNIFSNTMTSAAASNSFVAMWMPAFTNYAAVSINNNAYMVTNSSSHAIARVGTTLYYTMANWQPISQNSNATNDNASIPTSNSGGAPFMSLTNLNIAPNTTTSIESGAALIAALGTNTDFNSAVRPLAGVNPNTSPDIGAYEFDGVVPPPLVNDASANAFAAPGLFGCYSSTEPVSIQIKNWGTNSITNIPVTVTVTGAGTATLTGTYTGTLAPTATVNFVVGNMNMLAAGVYSFYASTGIVGDGNPLNDALGVVTRTVIAPLGFPYVQDFNASTILPAGMTATNYYVAANHGQGYNNNALTYNLYGTSATVAIVNLPKLGTTTVNTTLSYDYRVQDWSGYPTSGATTLANWTNDSLNVYVSADCGLTYSLVQTVNASNHTPTTNMTTNTVSLGAFSGSDIIVRFIAKKAPAGAGDYYLDLDNINIVSPVANDAGATALAAPGLTGCYSATEPVSITIKNHGTNPITNIPVTVTVSGVASATLTGTYTGTIAPTATANFVVGNLNMLTVGVYSFVASTSLPGDGQSSNDVMGVATRTVIAAVALPYSQDFNASTILPAGMLATNYYVASNHGQGYNNNALTYNLYGTSSIMGSVQLPKMGTVTGNTILKYDYRVQDWSGYPSSGATTLANWANDSLNIYISSDCGLTYSLVQTVNASNHTPSANMTTNQINLASYSGSDIIVRFIAKKDPAGTGDYYLDIDNINICNAPVAPVASGTAICTGNTTTLTASVGTGTNNWYATPTPTSAIATGTAYAVSGLTATTTFYVSEINSCGESTLSPVTVTVNASPVLTVSAGSQTICQGGSTSLNASGATSYTWDTGATGAIIAVTPTTNTTFTVTGDNSGCTSTETIAITVNSLPSVSLTAAQMNTCVNGSTIGLTGSPAGGVYTGSNVTGSSFMPGSTAGTFMPSYNVTDAITGCSNSASVTIVVNALPSLSLTASSTTVCANGPTVALTGSPAGGVYSGSNVSGSVFTPPSTAGTFVATYSYTDGVTACANTATTSIDVSICIGIENIGKELNGLQVYPNPNAGEFIVELGNGMEKTVEVSDLTGRIILSSVSDNDKVQVNIGSLANGVYFVKIQSNSKVEVIKVVKQ